MAQSDNTNGFLRNAVRFSKSPLGIIALLISFVYAFACLLIGPFNVELSADQELILTIFLVSFPIIVLFSFLFLVIRHNRKIFGPADFKDEKNFLETIDIVTQKSEIKDHIVDYRGTEEVYIIPTEKSNPINRFKDYLLVENLILRIVEKDYNLPQRRYVRFKGYKYTFDCVLEGPNEFIVTKIKFIRPEDEKYNQIVALKLRRRYYAFRKIADQYYTNKKRKMVIYIVYKSNIDSFKKELIGLFEKENNLEIEIKFFAHDYLVEKFLF